MAIGAGVGLRHSKVMPPRMMAAISAPAIAEPQCQRTGAALDVELTAELAAGGVEGGGDVSIVLYSGVWRAIVALPSVVRI
jgi:hypothetical protein